MKITTDAEYQAALREADVLMDSPEGGPRLMELASAIEAYEAIDDALPPPTQAGLLHYMLESEGRSRDDLRLILGGKSRMHEVLSGERMLTPEQMGRLHEMWDIPLGALVVVPQVQPELWLDVRARRQAEARAIVVAIISSRKAEIRAATTIKRAALHRFAVSGPSEVLRELRETASTQRDVVVYQHMQTHRAAS